MPDRVAMQMPTADVRDRQALHEAAHVAVAARPEHQVPMIRHQAVAQQPHAEPLGGLSQNQLERPIVGVLSENLHAGIPAIEHMKDPSAGGDAIGAGHEGGAYPSRRKPSIIGLIPFSDCSSP